MIAIPVPFVVALAIALLLAILLRRDVRPPSWSLTGFLLVAIFQSVLVGLRWSYDLSAARFILPLSAALLPSLAWTTVDALRRARRSLATQVLPSVVIVAVVALLVLLWRRPIDLTLAAIDAGYGIAILIVAGKNPDELDQARLGDAERIRPIILSLGGLLVTSAIVDGLVAFDFEFLGGTAAPTIVSIANLLALSAIAWGAALVRQTRPAQLPEGLGQVDPARERLPCGPVALDRHKVEAEDVAVLVTIDGLMSDRTLYRDPDLTLDRLARRAGLPARVISEAINRVHRVNVSQYVNGFRVAEAQRLLETTDRLVTAIMFDIGFQTKSNFNREFRRVAACSPTEWRRRRNAANPQS